MRSLQNTLSVRFPTSSAGDPYYASPSLQPHIRTLISLLSLHAPLSPTPLEHLSMKASYLPYLQTTHVTPLSVVQGILPLMRVPANVVSRLDTEKRKIVVCLPVIASRVGVAWNAAQAMSAGAMIKGIDVLRRELRESGQSRTVSVSIVDVGSVGSQGQEVTTIPYSTGAAAYMNDWSSNLRATYGPAFLGALEQNRMHPRVPEDLDIVVQQLAGFTDVPSTYPLTSVFDWHEWERVGLGAGGKKHLFEFPHTHLDHHSIYLYISFETPPNNPRYTPIAPKSLDPAKELPHCVDPRAGN